MDYTIKIMRKKALITGITGQDGSYLAEFLLEKGYEVHGLLRRSSTFNRQNIQHIFMNGNMSDNHIHYGDMSDINSLISVLEKVQPDEIYNLAAQSHVRVSFDVPFYTAQTDAIGVLSLLEAVRILKMTSKIYQASTSELFSGDKEESPQNEQTRFRPRSPYGVAKLYGYEISRVYKESYNIFVVNGILFNHESPRRGYNFVSRKITKAVANIKTGKQEVLYLGNIDASRDWGYAKDYVEAMWLMLQQETADDFVIATGERHTVREFIEKAAAKLDIHISWKGEGLQEIAVDQDGNTIITIDQKFYRKNDNTTIVGNPEKAATKLGWTATTDFQTLIDLMVDAEYDSQI